MTEFSIDELKQARYMTLTSPPASPEAKRLVDSIIDIILSAEQRKRSRQPSAAVAFKSAVGLIVGDLLVGLQTREVGWSYLSLSAAAFSDRNIGYKTFKPIVQAMETAGLINVSLGRNSQAIDFGGGHLGKRHWEAHNQNCQKILRQERGADLVACSKKAREELFWVPKVSFRELLQEIIEFENKKVSCWQGCAQHSRL